MSALNYSVQIHFGRHSCTVVGAHAGNALDVVAENARYYLTDSDGPHYEKVDVVIEPRCEKCSGKGRALKPRCKATYVACTACSASGYVPNAAWRTRIVSCEVEVQS